MLFYFIDTINWVAPSSYCYKGLSEVVITFYFMLVTMQRHQFYSIFAEEWCYCSSELERTETWNVFNGFQSRQH